MQIQEDTTVEQMKSYIESIYKDQTEENRRKLDAYAATLRNAQLTQKKVD